MTKQLRNLFSLTTCLLVCLLSLAIAGNAQTDDKAKKEQEKKGGIGGAIKGVGDKITGKAPSDEETEREYKKLLASATEKYENKAKPRFKERVDRAYKEKRREHNNYAFQMNTSNGNDELTTFTGDKLKLEDTVYDNLMVQDYINRVGHSLVPTQTHRYVFKVVLNPVPDARALTTGTIFLTTGLLSLVDTEAQLAYILAHEISHIEKMHWRQDAMVAIELEEQENSKRKKAGLIGLFSGIGIGAVTRSADYGVLGGLAAGFGTYGLLKFFDDKMGMEWEKVQEDEADKEAVRLIFERNYDPTEVPRFYARLQELADREPRLGDGFLARASRIGERFGYLGVAIAPLSAKPQMLRGSSNLRRLRAKDAGTSATISPLDANKPFPAIEEGKSLFSNPDLEKREKAAVQQVGQMKDLVAAKLERGEIVGASAEFDKVMADLKRDNGVRAFYYDMFSVALENLGEARMLRSDDPHAHFYYGKVLEISAKNRAEKADALAAFDLAIKHDRRNVLAESHLYRAVILMSNNNPNQNREIIEGLGKYVEVYQRTHSGSLPQNMDTIYTYLKGLGEHDWAVFPVLNTNNSRASEGSRATDAVAPMETVTRPETPVTPEVKAPETKPAPVQPDPKKGTTPPKKKP